MPREDIVKAVEMLLNHDLGRTEGNQVCLKVNNQLKHNSYNSGDVRVFNLSGELDERPRLHHFGV